jgi:hypothetical protein
MSKPARGTLVVQSYDPAKVLKRRLGLAAFWLLSLFAVYQACRYFMVPGFARAQSEIAVLNASLASAQGEIETLKAQVAQNQRAGQVSELASNSMESDLAKAKEDIAALRSELSFYEKVVSGGADQAGLTINDLELRATDNAGVYRFIVTLSQNLKKDRMAKGGITLSMRGVKNGKLMRLDFKDLSGTDGPKNVPFEFKYFQRVEGSIMLPEGFAADRLQVTADGDAGVGRVRRDFTWQNVVKTASAG